MLKKQTVHLRISEDMKAELALAAKRQNRTVSNLVHTVLTEWLLSDDNKVIRTYTGKPIKAPIDYVKAGGEDE